MVPLKEIYCSFFQDSNPEIDYIAGFFRRTLEIDDINWSVVISELEEMKLQPIISGEVVRQLYRILSENPPIHEDYKEEMR